MQQAVRALGRTHVPLRQVVAVIYKVKAYWPNSQTEPEVRRCAHYADALDWALSLQRSHKHTTILVLADDARLELVRLWGQPMPNGDDWP